MGPSTMIRILPGRWIQLPDTGIEVMLRGKYCDNDTPITVWWRHDPTTDTGYWDLTAVCPRLFVRGAASASVPDQVTTVRPKIRRRQT